MSDYQTPSYGSDALAAAMTYACWLQRVGSYLIDQIVPLVALTPFLVVGGLSDGPLGALLRFLGVAGAVGFMIWNAFLRQGQTGYTIGKSVMGIRLVSEATGQPIGAGMAFVRYLCHLLDSIFYVGYLWPLWDAKRQTFADKIMKTVVVVQPLV